MFKCIITYAEGYKVPSINNMYNIGRSGNKSWVFLNPEVANFKEHVKVSIIKSGYHDYFKDKSNIVLEVEIIIVMYENFWRRDISNTIKALEDAIAETIKVDDKHNLRVAIRKVKNDINTNEYIIITATDYPMSDEFRYVWSKIDDQPT